MIPLLIGAIVEYHSFSWTVSLPYLCLATW